MDQTSSPNNDTWLDQVKAGDFSAIPDPFTWKQSLFFSQAIGNMYRHAKALGLPKPIDLYEERLEEAKHKGKWRGTSVELWTVLWHSHRLTLIGMGLPTREDRPYLDQLCTQLRDQLQSVAPDEKAVITTLIQIAWTTQVYPLQAPLAHKG
ncbi:hypothetical protein MAE02_50930 [Microvirga aerophila]|uniref:Uncharacterized protein n=1 Tax=Microvirga aerophila TaxID=670291 RepID=A0A512C007_9HYPH|nr:hypothetical protein MAE02_50930 [Microvirga aerophila]